MCGLAVESQTVRISLYSFYTVLFLPVLILWFAAEVIDPSSEGSCTVRAFKNETTMRYDREMGKNIPGLDHHCKWLNTGIGCRNYLIFFVLIILIAILWTSQFLVGILILAIWNDTLEWGGYVLIGLHEALLLSFTWPVYQLIVFHVMLQRTGQSTYTYMANAAKKRSARRRQEREKREKEKEAKLNEMKQVEEGENVHSSPDEV
eukprot:g4818.t1